MVQRGDQQRPDRSFDRGTLVNQISEREAVRVSNSLTKCLATRSLCLTYYLFFSFKKFLQFPATPTTSITSESHYPTWNFQGHLWRPWRGTSALNL